MSDIPQSELWTTVAQNWRIQEETSKPLYTQLIALLAPGKGSSLLDIGCGTGYFLSLLEPFQLALTGADISETQLAIARQTLPQARFETAGMENLPFDSDIFDFVVANNSFQFSADFRKAAAEIYRVLKPGGKVVISLWDEPQHCESFCYFKAFYELTQEEPNAIPFNLSKPQQIKDILEQASFRVEATHAVLCPRIYRDMVVAVDGILSSGPANKAIRASSPEVVKGKVIEAIEPFRQADGSYKIVNSFRFTIGKK